MKRALLIKTFKSQWRQIIRIADRLLKYTDIVDQNNAKVLLDVISSLEGSAMLLHKLVNIIEEEK